MRHLYFLCSPWFGSRLAWKWVLYFCLKELYSFSTRGGWWRLKLVPKRVNPKIAYKILYFVWIKITRLIKYELYSRASVRRPKNILQCIACAIEKAVVFVAEMCPNGLWLQISHFTVENFAFKLETILQYLEKFFCKLKAVFVAEVSKVSGFSLKCYLHSLDTFLFVCRA